MIEVHYFISLYTLQRESAVWHIPDNLLFVMSQRKQRLRQVSDTTGQFFRTAQINSL